jgi:hypothetical protein
MECDSGPPVVTIDLVKRLLVLNGEFERADDSVLVQRMVDAAQSPSGCLDESAFVNALTSDLGAWDVGCEDKMSTSVYDVFGAHNLETFQRVGEENDLKTTREPFGSTNKQDEMERKPDEGVEQNGKITKTKTRRGNASDIVGAHNDNTFQRIVRDDEVESARDPLGFSNKQYESDEDKRRLVEDTENQGVVEKGVDTFKDIVEVTNSVGKGGKSDEDRNHRNESAVDTIGTHACETEIIRATSSEKLPTSSLERSGFDTKTEQRETKEEETTVEGDVKDSVGSAVPGGESVSIDMDDKSDSAEGTVRSLNENTMKIIDSVLDSYGSSAALLLIWLAYICHSATYASLVLTTDPFVYECTESTFGCTLLKTIYSWYGTEHKYLSDRLYPTHLFGLI